MKKAVALSLIALLVYAYFAFDLGQYLTMEFVKSSQQDVVQYYQANPLRTIALYMGVYILVTALSLPGATILTLAGAAVFGLLTGTVVVSFASTIGATLAFLVARFLLRDTVQNRFQDKLRTINRGIEKEGGFYLFTLRLIPVFPFFLINLLMGLTPMRTVQYFIVSQIGMLPGTIVYVNAGTQLGRIESLDGILSPGLIASFALLGVFPLLAKKLVDYLKSRKYLKPYRRPARFDYNMVVIGAGSGGLVAAYIAAAVKARVALVEKHQMGGDCLNTGCVPSKALIRSAGIAAQARRAREFGFDHIKVDFQFSRIMQRVHETIGKVAPHDSVERYNALGVECIQGEARIVSPYEVDVGGRVLTTRNIIVASGARPRVPDLPGLEQIPYCTSDSIWSLQDRPDRLLVLGGGPIGCELAQSMARLGSQVTLLQRGPRILPGEDEDVAKLVADRLAAEGMRILTGIETREFRLSDEGPLLKYVNSSGEDGEIHFDLVLLALGRQANTRGFGLEELGVRISERGTIEHDEFMRTNFPNIFVCGDVAGPFQFTHTASHQAWYASVNALFSPFKSFRADYRVIPRATYTDPEVARVGLNEQEAQAQGIAYELTTYGIDDLDRAIADGEDYGLVKVLTVPGKDRILGATVLAHHGADMLAEFVLAMKHGIGLNKILGTVHAYPTMSEANKYLAGNWKRSHAPEGLLAWVEKFHRWRRGG